MVTRFLLSLVYDLCESEGDAEGLRALRRIMVCYFLAKKPHRLDSKYASFTMIDLGKTSKLMCTKGGEGGLRRSFFALQ